MDHLPGRTADAAAPLVLLHGAGTSGALWHRVLEPLAAFGHAPLAPDVPGYGAAAAVGPRFAMPAVADALADRLADAAGGPFDLVGHSLGGALAIVLASRRPDAVRRLVLAAPAGLGAVPAPVVAALALGAWPYAVARRRIAGPLASNALVRRLAFAGIARDGARVPPDAARVALASSAGATRLGWGLASAARADLRGELAMLTMPLGAIWGAHDRVIPARRIAIVRAARPDVVWAVVADTAHAPMLERPEAFATALDDLLARLPLTG